MSKCKCKCKCGHSEEQHFLQVLEYQQELETLGGVKQTITAEKMARAWCGRCSCAQYEALVGEGEEQ